MTADETDFPEDISELARRHGRAAILVLAEIMTQEDAPAGARVTAAKALLERGWGKPGKPPEDGTRLRPVTQIVRKIIDPKQHGTIEKSRARHSAERPAASGSSLPPSMPSIKKGEGVVARCLRLRKPELRRMGVKHQSTVSAP